MNLNDYSLCEKCQEQFDKQGGQLRLLDMCESCKTNHILLILEPEDKTIH